MRLLGIVITIGLALGAAAPRAEPGLDDCVDQFPGGTIEHAPTRAGVAPVDSATGNVHICERSGETSFFALEYNAERLAPIWVAYRLADSFGSDRCGSVPRDHMRCYFGRADVQSCLASDRKPGDPSISRPSSWHLCGAYKTFTMANIAAQRDHLNRVTWKPLEAQVLHWGVALGPIYVVTGPIWTRFPEEKFDIFDLGQVDRELMAQPDQPLRPDPGEGPRIVRPTGFFTVVYRLASEDEDEQAVAFLVPHTHQPGLSFWSFIAMVAVVEEAGGLEFGFDERLKSGGQQR